MEKYYVGETVSYSVSVKKVQTKGSVKPSEITAQILKANTPFIVSLPTSMDEQSEGVYRVRHQTSGLKCGEHEIVVIAKIGDYVTIHKEKFILM